MTEYERKRTESIHILMNNLKTQREQLQKLYDEIELNSRMEHFTYRFYYRSLKVYAVQELTERIVEALKGLYPKRKLNTLFMEIIDAGTNKKFQMDDNRHWLESTEPIINAFYHAFKMLSLALQVSTEEYTDSGFISEELATLLCLYRLR